MSQNYLKTAPSRDVDIISESACVCGAVGARREKVKIRCNPYYTTEQNEIARVCDKNAMNMQNIDININIKIGHICARHIAHACIGSWHRNTCSSATMQHE